MKTNLTLLTNFILITSIYTLPAGEPGFFKSLTSKITSKLTPKFLKPKEEESVVSEEENEEAETETETETESKSKQKPKSSESNEPLISSVTKNLSALELNEKKPLINPLPDTSSTSPSPPSNNRVNDLSLPNELLREDPLIFRPPPPYPYPYPYPYPNRPEVNNINIRNDVYVDGYGRKHKRPCYPGTWNCYNPYEQNNYNDYDDYNNYDDYDSIPRPWLRSQNDEMIDENVDENMN